MSGLAIESYSDISLRTENVSASTILGRSFTSTSGPHRTWQQSDTNQKTGSIHRSISLTCSTNYGKVTSISESVIFVMDPHHRLKIFNVATVFIQCELVHANERSHRETISCFANIEICLTFELSICL